MSMRRSWRHLRTGGIPCLAMLMTLALTGDSSAQDQRPTAQEVIDQIKAHVGVPWRTETVDTFKAGDPATRVIGIAVTMMATMDVLKRAARQGLNLVITHEPTFYNHQDKPDGITESDAVWAEKRTFIEKHGLVVWRFHDHWHLRRPDGILAGTVNELKWEKYQDADNPHLFHLPPTTVRALATLVAQRLQSPVVRVVGDPQMPVREIALNPGAGGFAGEAKAMEMKGVDVVLVGETREWETVEYAADAVSEGAKKALIVIGHVPSEQAGMDECTRWLKTFVTGVPVQFVPTKQPFWVVGNVDPGNPVDAKVSH
jgi:putative NIF3 family GTP cyclohydrolase 1 type 2